MIHVNLLSSSGVTFLHSSTTEVTHTQMDSPNTNIQLGVILNRQLMYESRCKFTA